MISKAFSFCKSSPSFSSLFCKWIWWTKTGLKIWRIREGFYSKKHPFRTEKSLIQKIQKHLNLNFERVFKIKSYWLLDFFETKKSPEIIGTWCGSWGIRTPDPLLVRQMLWTSWAKLPFMFFLEGIAKVIWIRFYAIAFPVFFLDLFLNYWKWVEKKKSLPQIQQNTCTKPA